MENKTRTIQQNAALHLMFDRLADLLTESGLDMRKTLKPSISIQWTGQTIKEYLWRPIMKAQTGKESTTELTTKEIDQVFETINKHLGEKFGLKVTFPSMDSLINQSLIK